MMKSNLSDFTSQCSHLTAYRVPPTVVAPLWWWVGPACRDRNDHQPSRGHPMSVTQCYLAIKRMNVMFMFRAPLFMCGYSGQQCCVKDVFSILKQKTPISRKEPGRTEKHTQTFVLFHPIKNFHTFLCTNLSICRDLTFGAVRKKTYAQILGKLTPSPLSEKCPHWLNPPCPWGHTVISKQSKFFAPKSADVGIWRHLPPCPQNVRTGQPPPHLTADIFYGRPLFGHSSTGFKQAIAVDF